MFTEADTKSIAILATNSLPNQRHLIKHYTFRRTTSVKKQLVFELDHYDRHRVSQSAALRFPWIWRCNLLGGGRMFRLALRLNEYPTLKKYIDERVASCNWDYGEGYIEGSRGARSPADWLTGKPLLPTDALTKEGIDYDAAEGATVKAERFRSTYTQSRHTAPIVLFKQNWTLPLAFRESGFLAFKDKIVGISAPRQHATELRRLYERMKENRDVVRALACIFGRQILMGKATAFLKADIDSIPWPTEEEGWDFAEWEKVLCSDIVEFFADYIRLGQDSPLLTRKAGRDDLRRYAEVFLQAVGSVYREIRAGPAVECGSLIFQYFSVGNNHNSLQTPDSDTQRRVEQLVFEERAETLRTVRMLRL